MLINHVGLALPAPWPALGETLGRVSLPVFSLLIVFNLQTHTQQRASRYLEWLLFWALLTQPVYALLIANWQLGRGNALFTLACGACLIYLTHTGGLLLAGLAAGMVVSAAHWIDGGAWMPLAQWLAWVWMQKRPALPAVAIGLVAAAAFGMNLPPAAWVSGPALVALLGTPLLWLASPHWSSHLPRLPRLAFYAFYPLHLAVILSLHGAY